MIAKSRRRRGDERSTSKAVDAVVRGLWRRRGRPEEVGEDLGDLRGQVVAVRAFERSKVLTVPAGDAVVAERGAAGQRRYFGREVGVEEERERQPLVAAHVAYPVRRRLVPAARHAVEHVADVADE